MIVTNADNQHAIEYADRGFHYGDGLFETLEIENGRVVFLDRHLERLSTDCERLLIPFSNHKCLKQEIIKLAQTQKQAVLKIIITRGVGGRGYQQPEPINVTQALSLYPFPEYPADFKTNGISIRFCTTRLGQNQRLAGIKHLNKLEQVLARAEWQDPAIQEGFMFDNDNNLIEGTMSNVFLVENGCLLTPQLDQCGVEGIIKNIIIKLAIINGLTVNQARVSKYRVLSADEVFITNSIIGLWPVKKIAGHEFQLGNISGLLATSLEQFKLKDLQNAQ